MLIANMHMGVLVFLLLAVPGRGQVKASAPKGLISNRGGIVHDL